MTTILICDGPFYTHNFEICQLTGVFAYSVLLIKIFIKLTVKYESMETCSVLKKEHIFVVIFFEK